MSTTFQLQCRPISNPQCRSDSVYPPIISKSTHSLLIEPPVDCRVSLVVPLTEHLDMLEPVLLSLPVSFGHIDPVWSSSAGVEPEEKPSSESCVVETVNVIALCVPSAEVESWGRALHVGAVVPVTSCSAVVSVSDSSHGSPAASVASSVAVFASVNSCSTSVGQASAPFLVLLLALVGPPEVLSDRRRKDVLVRW